MSVQTKIEVIQDTATPEMKFLQAQLTPHRMAAEIGPRMTRMVQRNFLSKGENKKGWPSTHFWARAAEATNWQEGSGFVMIGINQIGVRQRLEGGDIYPGDGKKYLTIPAVPDAYGKRAADFSNLKFAFAVDPNNPGTVRPALVEERGTISGSDVNRKWVRGKDGYKQIISKNKKGKAEATGLVAIFWLLGSVSQKPDPTVLPSDDQFNQAMDQSMEALLRHPTITN